VKKWFRRLGICLAILVLTLLLAFAGSFAIPVFAARLAARDYPPPGRVYDINGRDAHIDCTGTGSPTVLLEAGLDTRGSLSWQGIRDDLSEVTRVCAYDRAGMMWSEAGDDPRDARQIAAELHDLVGAASESPPYVMVGHSLGGLLIRVYDQQYPAEVQGFVFVDASHPEQESRFPPEVRQLRQREGAYDWLIRFVARYSFLVDRGRAESAYRWKSTPEVLREADAADAMMEQARATGSLGDRPVIVLTAGRSDTIPGVSSEGNMEMRRSWAEMQEELAALSTRSEHRFVEGAGHFIHANRPQAVVTAIRDVLAAVRGGL
jgi:pimeloyl-ACP methyl ester carboxylesterase